MYFSQPRENVLQFALREGMRVADLGSGTGHYAQAAAAAVYSAGRVYAIDIHEDMLRHIKESTHKHYHNIIEPIWGDIEKPGGTGLRSESLDAAILANTLFQIEHQKGLIAEIKRILKPGGKILVVDWAGSYGGMGPSPAHVVSERAAEELFINEGFHKLKSFRGGPHHYAIVVSVSAS